MNLYVAYVQERQGHEVVHDEKSFIEFKVEGEICFLINMYIAPRYRKNGGGRRVWAKFMHTVLERGCKKIWAQVDLRTPIGKASLKSVENAGFENTGDNGKGLVFLLKELGG